MSKPCDTEIKLVTCPEGDWEKIYVNGKFLDTNHKTDWKELIKYLGYNLIITEISDEEMASNPYD